MPNANNGKIIRSQAEMDKAVKSICDILRRDKAKGARLYVPELTWMFFLRYLGIMERKEEQKAAALGTSFERTLPPPYRWWDWAAPFDHHVSAEDMFANQEQGWKRRELSEQAMGSFLSFVNDDLFPCLKNLGDHPAATNKQKVISEIFRLFGNPREAIGVLKRSFSTCWRAQRPASRANTLRAAVTR